MTSIIKQPRTWHRASEKAGQEQIAAVARRAIAPPSVAVVVVEKPRRTRRVKIRLIPTEGVAAILGAVCSFYRITQDELVGESRAASVHRPRLMAAKLLRCIYRGTHRQIGAALHRDPSTVFSMLQCANDLTFTDPIWCRHVEELCRWYRAGTYYAERGR